MISTNRSHSSIKKWTLFDHLSNIRTKKIRSAEIEDQLQSWNTFMINRLLSMDPDKVEFINSVQQWSHMLPKSAMSDLYSATLPKENRFYKYMSRKKSATIAILDVLRELFAISTKDALVMVSMMKSPEQQAYLTQLLKTYRREN